MDGGCYDGTNTLAFIKWCKGNYSKIFAFEPDATNCKKCEKCEKCFQKNGIQNIELIRAGLGEQADTLQFASNANEGSHILFDKARQRTGMSIMDPRI